MYLDYPWGYKYPSCIPHVSCMYPACLLHIRYINLSGWIWLFEIHVFSSCISDVSRMYLDYTLADTCISHVSRMYPASRIRTSQDTWWDTCISSCISDVSRMYLDYPSRYIYPACSSDLSSMYPACILNVSSNLFRYICNPHVSCMYSACILDVSCKYPSCIPNVSRVHSSSHRCAYLARSRVSCVCISVYLDVSWWRVQDTCILMYLMCIRNVSWTRLGYV